MTIDEYIKRFKELAEENNLPTEISDEEFAKMFISHMVVTEWQTKEQQRQILKEKRRLNRRYWKA